MKILTKYIFIGFVFVAILSGKAVSEVQVFAQVDSSADIYVGESFGYHIIIDGENKAGQADLSPLARYNPQSVGNRDVSQTSISIVNGRTTTSVIKRYVMSYSLTAQSEGRIQLPPVSVVIDGKTYRTNPVEVNILKPGTTDQLHLEVSLSEERCYVGQPVTITVKFYRYANIRDYQFNTPALGSDAFYVEEPDATRENPKEYRLNHRGRDAILLTFSKVLIPKYPGEMVMAPASVSADVAVGQVRSRAPFFEDFDFFGSRTTYKRFMASSEPLKLTVLPLPEEGKPSQFYGLVGRYTISASAAPTKVNVGDPITLTIKIGGSNYLKPVQWPALEELAELANNFRIPSQKSSPTIEGGFKVFTQTIRANNDKVSEIPPIPLAYFDQDKGKYIVAKTEPIKLEVAPTKVLTDADLQGRDFTPVNKEVEAIKKGLSANYEGPDVLQNMSFSPLAVVTSPDYLLLWAVPSAALILSSLIKFFTRTSPEKAALKRRRSASSRAVRRLKQVASSPPHQRHELLASIMKQYIGERFDKVAGSLTADDCYEVITTATQDMQTADKYREIIAQCEAASYTSIETDIDITQIRKVIELVRTIEKRSKK